MHLSKIPRGILVLLVRERHGCMQCLIRKDTTRAEWVSARAGPSLLGPPALRGTRGPRQGKSRAWPSAGSGESGKEMRQVSASAYLLLSPTSPGLAHTSSHTEHLPAKTSPKHSFFPEGCPGLPTRKQRPLPTAGAVRAVPASPCPGRWHLCASVRRFVTSPFTPCRCRRCRGTKTGR